jgi:hypothetical protein
MTDEKTDLERKIEYHRFTIRPEYGQSYLPPVDRGRVGERNYRYLLSIPYWLSEEQMKIILMTIAQFKKGYFPQRDMVQLVVPTNLDP